MSFESEEWNGQVGDDDARVYSAIGVLGNGATDKERGGRERERERERQRADFRNRCCSLKRLMYLLVHASKET